MFNRMTASNSSSPVGKKALVYDRLGAFSVHKFNSTAATLVAKIVHTPEKPKLALSVAKPEFKRSSTPMAKQVLRPQWRPKQSTSEIVKATLEVVPENIPKEPIVTTSEPIHEVPSVQSPELKDTFSVETVYVLSAKRLEGDDESQLIPKEEDTVPQVETDSALKKLFMMFSKPNLVMSGPCI